MDGYYTYAVKENGELVIGERNGNGKDGKATPSPDAGRRQGATSQSCWNGYNVER